MKFNIGLQGARGGVMDSIEKTNLGFNLLDEPWIPVVMLDGGTEELSLQELFEKAASIREIAGDCPQQSIVLIRLALAILYRSYGLWYKLEFEDLVKEGEGLNSYMDELWLETWQDGCFDEEVLTDYFEKFHESFDLFGEHPFMQTAGLAYLSKSGSADEDRCDPIDELVADVPKSNKFLFSMRARRSSKRDQPALEGLSFAEAARWLVFAQAFDVAGIKTPVAGNTHVKSGKAYPPKGLCGTGLLGSMEGVYLRGTNLFETLMWNWVLHDDRAKDSLAFLGNVEDVPAWELSQSIEPSDQTSDMLEASFKGPASLFAWQSRRIRLVPDDDGHFVKGIVVCYGDVTRLANAQGVETMCPWRESKPMQKQLGTAEVPWMPVQPNPGKALWRGSASLLSVSAEEKDFRPGVVRWAEHTSEMLKDQRLGGFSLSICSQGMSYGTQNSVFEDGFDDYFDISVALLRHDSEAVRGAIEVVAQADKAIFALRRFAENLERAAGDKKSGGQLSTWGNFVEERAYAELDGIFRDRFARFSEDESAYEYCDAWRDEVHLVLLHLGQELLDRTGATQFSGHGDYPVANAFAMYKGALNKNLGKLAETLSADESMAGKEQQ